MGQNIKSCIFPFNFSFFLDPPMVGLTMLYVNQAVEAEVLIALKRVKGRCVLVGDPCQLPATVFQRPGL